MSSPDCASRSRLINLSRKLFDAADLVFPLRRHEPGHGIKIRKLRPSLEPISNPGIAVANR
ncbi:hypothetical protein GCM10009789_11230 [Kribbella sancticallisti]|uniref:Uncharacterized protein n=1 Tax=Kribbella sancticallisti TaxID=460087 RepID=A0ABP4NFK4_9ACTN